MSSSHANSPSELPPQENGGPGLLALQYVLFAFATFTIALRSYIQLYITRTWGWDDSIIWVAWCFLLIADILMNLEVNSGVGQHIEYLPNPETGALQVRKWNNFYEMAICVCTFVTKLSITLYVLRIKNTKTIKWTLWVMMTFMGLAAISCIVVLAVVCVPLERFWDPTIDGTCLPLDTVYDIGYVQSAFTIVTDLSLTISPIIILWNVKINIVKKILVCVLMSLGLIATLANALRNYYQQGLIVEDYTYAMIPVSVVAILELHFGLIAACVPACMPIFRLGRKKAERSYGYSGYSNTGRSGPRPTYLGSQTSSVGQETLNKDDWKDTHSLSKLYTSQGQL